MAKYIPLDALVAEIERLKVEYLKHSRNKFCAEWSCGTLDNIFSFIDTLEVKEVDLDFQRFAKEMDAIFALPSSETEITEENPLNWEFAIAKHFFELGFKAQKGE